MSPAPTAQNSGKQRGKPFAKGQSGNPGGRPKTSGAVQDLARALTPDAIKALKEALQDDKLKVAAAKVILDRGWGCAPQSLEMSGKDGGPIEFTVREI